MRVSYGNSELCIVCADDLPLIYSRDLNYPKGTYILCVITNTSKDIYVTPVFGSLEEVFRKGYELEMGENWFFYVYENDIIILNSNSRFLKFCMA